METLPLKKINPSVHGQTLFSLYQHYQLFLLVDEIKELFEECGEAPLWKNATMATIDQLRNPLSSFLQAYEGYVQCCLEKKPIVQEYRLILSNFYSVDLDALALQPIREEEYLVKPMLPALQLRMHQMVYSHEGNKILSMSYGSSTRYFGLQFSYPQIMQNTKQGVHLKLSEMDTPNQGMFTRLRRWVRHCTLPATFYVDGKELKSTIRIGKRAQQRIDDGYRTCLHW